MTILRVNCVVGQMIWNDILVQRLIKITISIIAWYNLYDKVLLEDEECLVIQWSPDFNVVFTHGIPPY